MTQVQNSIILHNRALYVEGVEDAATVANSDTYSPFSETVIRDLTLSSDPVVFGGGIYPLSDDAVPSNTALLQETGRASVYVHSYGMELYSQSMPSVIQNFSASGPGIFEMSERNPNWQAQLLTNHWQPKEAFDNTLDFGGNLTASDYAQAMQDVAQANAAGIQLVLPIISPNLGIYGNWLTDPAWTLERELAQKMGGIAIDTPANYFINMPASYRDFVEQEIKWANANGLVSAIIVSPYNVSTDNGMPDGWYPQFWSDPTFLEATKQEVAILVSNGAVPTQWVAENYGDTPYMTQIGSDADPESVNGVALWLAESAPTSPEPINLIGLNSEIVTQFSGIVTATAVISCKDSGSAIFYFSGVGTISSDGHTFTVSGSALSVQAALNSVTIIGTSLVGSSQSIALTISDDINTVQLASSLVILAAPSEIIGSVLIAGIGQAGIVISLIGPDGLEQSSVTTDGAGLYKFEALAAGSYQVEYSAPTGQKFVMASDSPATRLTLPVSLVAGQTASLSPESLAFTGLAAASDFNGDGKSDILWQNDDGTPAIWEMNGTTTINSATLANPGPSWHIKSTGDFNGDSKSDIFWQNDNGVAAIWEMNGTTTINSATLANPGTSWHAIGSDGMQFIDGTTGNSTLLATSEEDTFIFTSYAAGVHEIVGFNPANDIIEFSVGKFSSLASIEAHSSNSVNRMLIALDSNASLVVQGVTSESLSATNFKFV